ncbi:MAG TPA: DHA2 family efflux MFS transporter permease subunit [Kofleriaceae bacterium]|nr:DHA2 family efflux MFS transporter permease subunit [Kofleriaceae bacterium]
MATATSSPAAVTVLDDGPPPGVNKWAVAVAVALGALLEVVDTSIVNVALTNMQNAFGATLTQVSWVVSSYAVANVIILPLTAWLGFRFGKKRYFIWSLIGFTVASALCGLAPNLPVLIAARVLQGIMGGGLLAKAQAILFETFPKSEQAAAQGFFGIIVIAGPTIGPTLGGYLTTNVSWRWIFYINLPLGIAAVLMCMAMLPDDKPGKVKTPVDWTALGMLAIGLGALQTVLEEGQSEQWFDSTFITVMVVAAILGLALFIHRELHSRAPIVDLRVLRYRSLWAGSILSVVVGMALYGAIFAVPIFAQTILGYSAQQTGLLLLPSALCSAAMMPIASKLIGKFDPRVLLASGMMIMIASMRWLGEMSPATGEDNMFWPLIIRSVGTALMFLPLSMATLGPIPKKDISAASGFYNLTRQLGGSIGVALLSTLLERRQAFHRAVVVEKLSSSDPQVAARVAAYTQKFLGLGYTGPDATAHAHKLLDVGVSVQASVISFGDCFWAVSILIACSIPLVFLLGKPARGVKVDAGH